MTSDVYDSDDALNRSPQLVAQKVNYQVEEPRPPFARPESPKRNATGKDAAGTPGRSQPNRPDIWEFEEKDPLNQPWPPPDRNPLEDRKPVQKKEESLKQTAEEAVHQLQPKDPPGLETKPVSSPVAVQPPGMKKELNSPGQRPRLPPISALDTSLGDPPRFFPPHGDSTKCSPEEPARVSLPSLQSPQSSTNFPDQKNTQSLPSIQSALSGLTPTEFPPSRINGLPPPYPYPGTAGSMAPRHDPPHDRRISGPLPPHHIPPSPFSHFSPTSAKDMSNNPSPASQPTFWRRPSQSQAEMGHGTSPYEMPPVSAQSPTTGYPTPTEHVNAVPGELTSLSSNPSTAGTGTTGNYKCSHPGCTAASFQTQYLLNSHANVHSQERPHFCPVEGCPRGLGGKGFKRKNEMMRHGLVHNSPGYVCPFCPDQQHKYPRPDNLQRHVRVHHVDKSKDDPVLRQVLAQRPPGNTRGRRRRANT